MRVLLVALVACSTPPAKPPVPSACNLAGAWEYGQPDALRLHPSGKIFGTLIDPQTAKLVLAPDSAEVELAGKSLRVKGFVERGALRLHPARAMLLGDAFAPGPSAVLRPAGDQFELAAPKYMAAKPVRTKLACNDLALVPAQFDPREVLPPAQTASALSAGVAIPLAAQPDAAPIGELRFTEPAPADVVDRKADRVRVVLDAWGDPDADTFVVGWVPASLVVAGPQGHAVNTTTGGGRGAVTGRPRGTRHVTCTREVPLSIELDGKRSVVGAILPGAEISLVGETEIAPERLGLQLADGARAFVASLDGCATASE